MLNPCKQFRSYLRSKQSGFFSVLYVRYVFRHRKLVYQILNVNKSPPFSDLNQRLNINISVFFLYICVFSFPCPSHAFSFYYSFLSHYAVFHSFLFSVLFVTSLLLNVLVGSAVPFILKLVSLYSLLFILLQDYVFYPGCEPEATCIYA